MAAKICATVTNNNNNSLKGSPSCYSQDMLCLTCGLQVEGSPCLVLTSVVLLCPSRSSRLSMQSFLFLCCSVLCCLTFIGGNGYVFNWRSSSEWVVISWIRSSITMVILTFILICRLPPFHSTKWGALMMTFFSYYLLCTWQWNVVQEFGHPTIILLNHSFQYEWVNFTSKHLLATFI